MSHTIFEDFAAAAICRNSPRVSLPIFNLKYVWKAFFLDGVATWIPGVGALPLRPRIKAA